MHLHIIIYWTIIIFKRININALSSLTFWELKNFAGIESYSARHSTTTELCTQPYHYLLVE